MAIPFAPNLRAFIGRLGSQVAALGIPHTPDDVLDWFGDLYSDDLVDMLEGPSDWHAVWWNRDVANTGEFLSVVPDRAGSVAAVLSQARTEGQELDSAETVGDEVVVWQAGQIYARIARVSYEQPRADLVRRMETLLGPVKSSDEVTLVRKLMGLPAWHLEPYSFHHAWSDEILPVGSPRSGEWLLPVSQTHGSKVHELDDLLEDSVNGIMEQMRRRDEAREQVLCPMWPTPHSLAKLLRRLLAKKAHEPPKLSSCQEAIAQAYDYPSWNAFVAAFKAASIPQVLARRVEDTENAVPSVRFFCSAPHLLAAVYEDALVLQQRGGKMHIGVSWLSTPSISVEFRDRAKQLLAEQIAAAAGVTLEEMRQGDTSNWAQWSLHEARLKAQANEWHSIPILHLHAGYADEDLRDAKELLGVKAVALTHS